MFVGNLWQNVALALLPKGNPGATPVSITSGNTFCWWLEWIKEATELDLIPVIH